MFRTISRLSRAEREKEEKNEKNIATRIRSDVSTHTLNTENTVIEG